ncbi:MFS transporter [Aliiroseovarius sp. 2305UL8-7]|uniref:MFS transporter n=1 Tax=Aliiroseovarius conchicola TaxID=3121637 RepID=UPI003528E43F
MIFLLWLAGLGAAAQFAKFAVPFAFVRAQYAGAGVEIGWLLTLISAVGAILGMMAGVFVVRFGCARVLVLSLLLGAGLSFWQASLPGLTVMLLSRLIEGLSHLAIVVAAPTLIAQISTDRFRDMSMTLWSTFFSVSFALVAWFGLPYVATEGLSSLLVVHGVFMLVVAVLLVAMSVLSRDASPKVTTPLNIKAVARQHIRAYRSPFISAPAFGWLFYTLSFVSLLAVLPDLLPDNSRAIVAGLMPLASIVVSLVVVSAMLILFSAVTIAILGFALAVLTIGLFFLGLPLIPICIGLFGVLGLVQGASFAAVPQLNTTEEDQALAYGAMAQMGNLGNLLGTPLLLAVLGYTDVSGLLTAVAGLYFLGILVHVFLARSRAAISR